MHGYIDSILIPIHLPLPLPLTPTNPSTAATTTTSSSKKGKEKAAPGSSLSYNVVTSWSTKELETIKNIFNLASNRKYSYLSYLSLP